jgi:hypothetical protein
VVAKFFASGKTGPVDYESRQLWLAYRFVVQPGDRLHLFFERSRQKPRQGISVGCDTKRQKLRVNQHEASGFTLWPDTAPKHVELEYVPARSTGTIYLMNVWELPEHGTVMRGVNAAAMAVRQLRDGEWLFECNDGYGTEPPTFDHIVVRLIHEPARGTSR